MSNKQSSVEWIIKQLIFKTEFENLPNHYVLMSDKDIDSIVEQAKAMHKEEIKESLQEFIDITLSDEICEEYYEQTFGGNK